MVALVGLDARQQPQRGERREGVEVHAAPAARAADLAHAGIEPLQRRRHRSEQRDTVAGEGDAAGAAGEQRAADLVLQRLDLAADGRLREVQLLGRGTEAEVARDGLEGADRADGERALA
ncbi:hypothetical protein X551_04762 [Methylibium sp. T29]|nr:hypothetical protein X551_04762 [Methylibium sp. T29]